LIPSAFCLQGQASAYSSSAACNATAVFGLTCAGAPVNPWVKARRPHLAGRPRITGPRTIPLSGQRINSDDSTWRNESLGARTFKKTSMFSFGSWTGMDWHDVYRGIASRAQELQGSFT